MRERIAKNEYTNQYGNALIKKCKYPLISILEVKNGELVHTVVIFSVSAVVNENPFCPRPVLKTCATFRVRFLPWLSG